MSNSRRCGSGHVYDADLYATCPYCNGQGNSIQFGAVPVTPDAGRTVAPGMMQFEDPIMSDIIGNMQPMYQNPEEMGKTIAPEGYLNKENQQGKTIGVFKKKFSLDPVVGWVVCVEGADRGKSFELYAKVNIIGRGEKADITLQDRTVSKEQVKLGYDVKHNNFYLIPGESVNNTYLNDMPLYVPTLINAYDLVEIGETKLMFMPFCGERFQWSSTNKQGE